MRRLLTAQLLGCTLLFLSCQNKENHRAQEPGIDESTLGVNSPIPAADTGQIPTLDEPNPAGLTPDPHAQPILTHWEDQFWVYRLEEDALVFNTPWDKVPGHEIRKTAEDMPDTAKDCLNQAKQRFAAVQHSEELGQRLLRLVQGGATARIIFLVNVVPSAARRNELRRLDRDAYFWHWNQQDRRPALAFNNFKQGAWVWEVISSPESCEQPDVKEMNRYLDYAANRLGLL